MTPDAVAERYGLTIEDVAREGHECERSDTRGRPYCNWNGSEFAVSVRFLRWMKERYGSDERRGK